MDKTLLAASAAYLIGAFPSAYVFSKLFSGMDIRKVGSGNVGGMNTFKFVGKLPGLLTIVFDIGKGVLAVYLASLISGESLTVVLLSAFLAVLGHNLNPFLRFQGGKGLGTSLGLMLYLSPMTAVYMIVLMGLLGLALRDLNTGAGAGILALPLVLRSQHNEWVWVAAGAAIAVTVALKHLHDFQAYRKGRRRIL